jgi:hypothetical protein
MDRTDYGAETRRGEGRMLPARNDAFAPVARRQCASPGDAGRDRTLATISGVACFRRFHTSKAGSIAMGLFSKDIKNMDDLFVHTLRDMCYAENQIVKLTSMAEAEINRRAA